MTDDWAVGPYTLRSHQVAAVKQLRRAMSECQKAGKRPRVLLQGVCGFGKTIVSSYLMKCAIAKGRKVAFICHGRILVLQKSGKLSESGIEHQVCMANSAKHLGDHSGQYMGGETPTAAVVSKDTYESLRKRGEVEPWDVDLWIVDEAHMALSEAWWKLFNESPAPMIGLTGTPARSNGLGLGDRWSEIVISATHEELLSAGMIVPCKVFDPWGVDTRGVDVNSETGEYVQDDIAKRCFSNVLVGDFCEEWHRLSEGRRTFFYASSVAHSIAQAKQNTEGDGTLFARRSNWEHIDHETSPSERKRILEALESHDIDGICNYAVLRVGVDLPNVGCLQLGVAMNSLVAYLQTVGRGQRPADGKDDFIIIDHGHNVSRHPPWPQSDRPWNLDERKPLYEIERTSGDSPPKNRTCECGCVYKTSLKECPACGEHKVRKGELVKTVSGMLCEVEAPSQPVKREPRRIGDEQKLWDQMFYPSSRSRSPRANTFNQLRGRFMDKYPHLKIVYSGNETRIVNKHTNASYRLGKVPPPHSPLWDMRVRGVEYSDLQRESFIPNGDG